MPPKRGDGAARHAKPLTGGRSKSTIAARARPTMPVNAPWTLAAIFFEDRVKLSKIASGFNSLRSATLRETALGRATAGFRGVSCASEAPIFCNFSSMPSTNSPIALSKYCPKESAFSKASSKVAFSLDNFFATMASEPLMLASVMPLTERFASAMACEMEFAESRAEPNMNFTLSAMSSWPAVVKPLSTAVPTNLTASVIEDQAVEVLFNVVVIDVSKASNFLSCFAFLKAAKASVACSSNESTLIEMVCNVEFTAEVSLSTTLSARPSALVTASLAASLIESQSHWVLSTFNTLRPCSNADSSSAKPQDASSNGSPRAPALRGRHAPHEPERQRMAHTADNNFVVCLEGISGRQAPQYRKPITAPAGGEGVALRAWT
mmetsp:Transcript_78566/g.168352  ORF Transcript_78566/g.168352 Transcript_78566/m.168352 type:complete len:379 (+) Transcript_78566:95-1231(+)